MNSYTGSDDAQNCQKCEFEQNIAILRSVDYFSAMPLDMLKALAFLCRHKEFRAGEAVFVQGEMDDCAYSIIRGEAELVRREEGREDGGEDVVVAEYGPGTFLGVLTLLGEARRLFTLRAKGDMTVMVMSRRKVLATMAENRDAVREFLQTVARSVVRWEQRALDKGIAAECTRENAGVSLL